MSESENRHEEMTKLVTAHMPVAFFGDSGKGKASTMCTCGSEITGYNKTPEEIHAEHIVLELEKAEFLKERAVKTEAGPRPGDRVRINSVNSRFHGIEGTLERVLNQEVVPYRVQLPEYAKPIPFFKHEVEVLPVEEEKPEFEVGALVKIENTESTLHGNTGRVMRHHSENGYSFYELRISGTTLVAAEYPENLRKTDKASPM